MNNYDNYIDPTILAYSDLLTYAISQNPNYEIGNHHRVIAEELMRIERGETRRLIITMPPRHGKSKIASEYFPAWYIGRNPSRQVMFATYSDTKAVDVGRSVRNQLLDPVFGEIFHNCQISPDAKAATSFTTTDEGMYFAVGVGGAATGRGAHLLICDDVIKGREQAESVSTRDKIIDWFGSVAYTRLMKGNNAIILIMTRWHYDDLAGYAMNELQHENWKIIDMPAIAECDSTHTFDNGEEWTRREGEALWPEWYDIERLRTIKATLKSRDWSSLYQQSPQPDEGGMVNLEWFNGPDNSLRFDIKAMPRFEYIYFSADTAFKDKEANDPSSILVFGEHGGFFYLIDAVNERMQFPKLKSECKRLYSKYKHAATGGIKAFLVEDKASGQSLLQDLRVDKEVQMPLIAITPDLNKILRLDECTGFLEGGIVKLPKRAKWLTDFETQITRFPYDKHDDMVDALSQFLKWKLKIRKFVARKDKKKRFWK